jgi:hypothetical protein
VEVPLPWERLLWQYRPLSWRGTRYALTDVRLVVVDGQRSEELAVDDITEIAQARTVVDRLLGTSTLIVGSRRDRRSPLILRRVRQGDSLAAVLDILASGSFGLADPAAVQAALSWKPKTIPGGYGPAFTGAAAMLITILALAVGLRGKAASVSYSLDDSIYPSGQKQSREAIVQFMEQRVMPWARQALAPIKGGADRVTCETCHGADAIARDWRMPAVRALPEPDVTLRGWETYSGTMDAQMRNAIYGYTAESDKQAKAAYMRRVVMPGMAGLLHRSPYDFAKPYDYNRTRAAFGCYHCHRVR